MSLINPADSLQRQNDKLVRITESLMRRVEQQTEQSGLAYAQFERAAMLEAQVRQRTLDLERTLDLLHESNAQLAHANTELEAARANLAEAIETIEEGFALFDNEDRLVLSNSRFCRDLKDVMDELRPGIGFRDYVGIISRSRYLSLPQDVSPSGWADKRMRRHADSHVVFNVSLKFDRWIQVSEHRTVNGGTVILQTDVTEIMLLERKERDRLMDSQARMIRATLDHLNQGVCIFDRALQLVGWNRRMESFFALPDDTEISGIAFDRLMGLMADQIRFEDAAADDRFRAWAHARRNRQPMAFEIRNRHDRILSVFAQEMPDRGFVVSFTDITTEREASRALFEANEMLERRVEERTLELGDALDEARRANASKTRFVAAASHDLLQPLSAAKLYLANLTEKSPPETARELADKATLALVSAEAIIEALLDISKLDLGKAAFAKQPMALDRIFDMLRSELTPIAAARGLQLAIVPCSLAVQSDPRYLQRILQNLIGNAIRYTQTGKVLVGARRNGGSVRLEVWDTGPGIKPEDQELIFQEFRQLTPGGGGGLGLGLAIVERACIGLDHPLGLWSEPGRGSCFSLNVPICADSPNRAADDAARAPVAEPPAQGLLLLLVENDPDLARAISLTIEGWGNHVLHAANAEEALDLLDLIDVVPDGALVDYHLGDGMRGTDFVDRLHKTYGAVPARVISADRSRTLRRACQALGVGLLQKPIDTGKLSALIHDMAARRG